MFYKVAIFILGLLLGSGIYAQSASKKAQITEKGLQDIQRRAHDIRENLNKVWMNRKTSYKDAVNQEFARTFEKVTTYLDEIDKTLGLKDDALKQLEMEQKESKASSLSLNQDIISQIDSFFEKANFLLDEIKTALDMRESLKDETQDTSELTGIHEMDESTLGKIAYFQSLIGTLQDAVKGKPITTPTLQPSPSQAGAKRPASYPTKNYHRKPRAKITPSEEVAPSSGPRVKYHLSSPATVEKTTPVGEDLLD